ncbi:hypothetical protein IWW34DRAFT_846047 [Fusarium oxysporum f. sp. albedinis]|nr:hypothetical protein FOMA001_g7230 [Fusarium oxysporum f. sp. matthiolae]KAI3582007.1 hypothetical protein IWW34DRAFT_846047 [Fusarium oxysporum f. sp. albedinis]KAJ0137698.1 Uncharacterized protein HZ326_19318 [Fusarium oxysporum f. sp. albedinis]
MSPDGETSAFACWALEGSDFSQRMELWHIGRGARVDKFTIDDPAFALTWTQDGLGLLSISPEGKVLAYDLLPKSATTMNGNEVSIDPYALTDILYIWNYKPERSSNH